MIIYPYLCIYLFICISTFLSVFLTSPLSLFPSFLIFPLFFCFSFPYISLFSADVKAYYFHGTHRCVTCQAVEAVTKEALKEYYGDKVPFSSINSEEDSRNPMIDKYKVEETRV